MRSSLSRGGPRRGPNHLARQAAKRLASGLLMLLVVVILVFVATSLLPGDPATAALGKLASPQNLAEVRVQLGLDKPPAERFLSWLGDTLTGNLGESIQAKQPTWSLIGDRMANSAILALVTTLFLIPLSLLLGALTGARAGRWLDRVVMSTSLIAISLPEFVTGSILIFVFALQLGWLPAVSLYAPGVDPLSDPSKLVLPVLTLLAASLAQTTRLVRAGVLATEGAEFVQMARLRGIPERDILFRHVLRNALVPSVQVMALALQYLVGGIVITEIVFNYPGIGSALVQAVGVRDYPVVQACALFIAAVYIAINVIADILVLFLTPKLRTG